MEAELFDGIINHGNISNSLGIASRGNISAISDKTYSAEDGKDCHNNNEFYKGKTLCIFIHTFFGEIEMIMYAPFQSQIGRNYILLKYRRIQRIIKRNKVVPIISQYTTK